MQLLEQLKRLRSKIKRVELLQETTQVSFILLAVHHKRLSLCRDCPNTNRLSKAPRLLLLQAKPLPKNYKRNLPGRRTDNLCATHLEAYSQSQLYLEMILAEKEHHYRANSRLKHRNPRLWLWNPRRVKPKKSFKTLSSTTSQVARVATDEAMNLVEQVSSKTGKAWRSPSSTSGTAPNVLKTLSWRQIQITTSTKGNSRTLTTS